MNMHDFEFEPRIPSVAQSPLKV